MLLRPVPAGRALLRPLLPLLIFFGFGLTLLASSRLLLVLGFAGQRGAAAELPGLFLTGLRFDVLTLSYLALPAWTLACLSPGAWERVIKAGLKAYFIGVLVLIGVLECAAWPSLREFGSRPESLFLEYLSHPHEVLGMVLQGFTGALLGGLAAAGLILWTARRALGASFAGSWPRGYRRVLAFPLGAALLVVGARSSLQHRPANRSSAAFSQNHFHNEAALNSTYTLLYAAYARRHEAKAGKHYGSLPFTRALELVQHTSRLSTGDFAHAPAQPTWHRQATLTPEPAHRPNVVILLLESVGAEYTGRLGGTRLTPNLDRLAEQGICFDRLFSTGTRTSRGLEAVVCGFFPTPARSVLKLGLAQRDFFSAPTLFRSAGYSTHFIYGGAANFDEMKAFFRANGVEQVWDQEALQRPEHAVGVWGIHDEDLFAEADGIFRRQNDQPFFAIVLSTSNHSPFDYPHQRIEQDPAFPVASPENAIKYTDYALGRFFERARSAGYFANTLFLIVADHGTRVSGDALVPVHKFHIPGILLGPPDLVRPESIQTLASQVDLMPTLLSLTGRTWEHPMMGQNLLALTPAERANPHSGRALLQYEAHFGYWKNKDMVILRPELPPLQFGVGQNGPSHAAAFKLTPEPVDPALTEEALAHSLLPSLLYQQRLYRDQPPGATDPRRVLPLQTAR